MTARIKPLACDRCGALPALRTVEDERSDGTVRYQYVYMCTRCHQRPAVYSETQTKARKVWDLGVKGRMKVMP